MEIKRQAGERERERERDIEGERRDGLEAKHAHTVVLLHAAKAPLRQPATSLHIAVRIDAGCGWQRDLRLYTEAKASTLDGVLVTGLLQEPVHVPLCKLKSCCIKRPVLSDVLMQASYLQLHPDFTPSVCAAGQRGSG